VTLSLRLRVLGWRVAVVDVRLDVTEATAGGDTAAARAAGRPIKRVSRWWVKGMTS